MDAAREADPKVDPKSVEESAELVAAHAAESDGFSMAFRWVSVLPAILVFVFGAIVLWDHAHGGYKPEILISREEEDELMAGGAQGTVE